jgi:ubiquinone/menaquinone biosynthesis C-methylase UbiE
MINPPKERFSDRVENYVKYRPTYPKETVGKLKRYCHLDVNSMVADIGSGTGIFSSLLLKAGFRVFGVEPNDDMRTAAERKFSGNPLFQSIPASAEDTGLESGSIDLVTAAQAFHWFDLDKCRQEFKRILKPNGFIGLIWNQRKTDSPFQKAYEELLDRHASEYKSVGHRKIDENIVGGFFGKMKYSLFRFNNVQRFDLEGLTGRMLSSSYTPTPEHHEYEALMAGLKSIFTAHSRNNHVAFEYETRLFIGKLK